MFSLNCAFIRQVGVAKWAFRTAIRQFYKRILRRNITMRLPTGEQFVVPRDNQHGSEVFVTNGNIDWGSERLLYKIFPVGGTFLDVGAHIGYYAVYMRPKAAVIHCCEADPRIAADGNPPARPKAPEVEFSMKESLREEVKIYRQPDHGCAQTG